MQKQYTVQSPDGRTITIEGPDGASEDEVIRQAQQLMAGDTAATQQFNPPPPPAPPMPAGLMNDPQEDPRLQKVRQLTIGANPMELQQRFAGVGDTMLDTVRALRQWGQSAMGRPVTPTPPPESFVDPNRQIGRNVGTFAQYMAPAALTAGASLPVQVGVQGLGNAVIAAGQGQDIPIAAGVGMASPVLSRTVSVLRGTMQAKDNPARALNATMEVPPAAITKTVNPGKQLLKEKDLSFLKRMGLSKESLYTLLRGRREEVGQQLGRELSRHNTISLDLSKIPGMDAPRVGEVLREMGRTYQPGQPIVMSPQEAHAFRSLVGDKINWSETAQAANDPTGMNELLKSLYRETSNIIETQVPGIKEINRKWANYFVGEQATKWALRRQATSLPGVPGTSLFSEIKRIGSASPITTTYAPTSRAVSGMFPKRGAGIGHAPKAAILGAQERED